MGSLEGFKSRSALAVFSGLRQGEFPLAFPTSLAQAEWKRLLCNPRAEWGFIKGRLCRLPGSVDLVWSNDLVNFLEIGAADGFRIKNCIWNDRHSRGQYFLPFLWRHSTSSVFLGILGFLWIGAPWNTTCLCNTIKCVLLSMLRWDSELLGLGLRRWKE